MADRVGVISKGRLILVEEKHALIKKLGRKKLTLNLAEPLAAVPGELAEWRLELAGEGHELVYDFDSQAESTGLPSLLRRTVAIGIEINASNRKGFLMGTCFADSRDS